MHLFCLFTNWHWTHHHQINTTQEMTSKFKSVTYNSEALGGLVAFERMWTFFSFFWKESHILLLFRMKQFIYSLVLYSSYLCNHAWHMAGFLYINSGVMHEKAITCVYLHSLSSILMVLFFSALLAPLLLFPHLNFLQLFWLALWLSYSCLRTE